MLLLQFVLNTIKGLVLEKKSIAFNKKLAHRQPPVSLCELSLKLINGLTLYFFHATQSTIKFLLDFNLFLAKLYLISPLLGGSQDFSDIRI